MNVAGIVCEYNPFHMGHKFHIDKTRELTSSDYVVAVMSPNFVQRGEPSIIDKFTRTRLALENGIDICIELPTLFACSSAEFFAHAAVKLLDDTGIVTHLSFGSESNDLNTLENIADILINESESFKNILKENINKGMSFPNAREASLKTHLNKNINLNFSNDILGIEYLKALKKLNSSITPLSVKRIGENYNSKNIDVKTASASGIRNALEKNKISSIEKFLPENVFKKIKEFNELNSLVFLDDFSDVFHYVLRSSSNKCLSEILDMDEGLENRFLNNADCANISEIIDKVKTKRYTRTKISRAVIHSILGITKDDLDSSIKSGFSPYIHVLGFKKSSEKLLSKMIQSSKVPVLTNVNKSLSVLDEKSRIFLENEIKYTNIYNLSNYKKLNQDLTEPIVII